MNDFNEMFINLMLIALCVIIFKKYVQYVYERYDMANALARLFGATDADQTYGGGMAEKAANTIGQTKAYRDYVMKMNEDGKEPLPMKDWAMTNG
jgi:hypothetical protein